MANQPATFTNDLVEQQWRLYRRDRDAGGHQRYLTVAKRCNEFYQGEQWDPKDLEKLGDRPALTLNVVLSTVNAILGEQSSRRADMQFKPRKGGATEQVASALTKLALQVSDNNELEWREAELFADGIITSRGYYDVRLDFSDHIRGEIRIESEDPFDIILDADAKNYDPKTWKRVTKTRWLSLDDIEIMYGKAKRNELEASIFSTEDVAAFDGDSLKFTESATFGGDNDNPIQDLSILSPEELGSQLSIRVIERQHYKLVRTKFFVSNDHGDMRRIPDGWDDAKVEQYKLRFNMSVFEMPAHRVRWTVTAHRTLLHDDWSPYDTFTIIPYFAYFRRGRPFGVVENLLSPQELLNKSSSQELHVVNTTANSGWAVEAGSLVNLTVDELEERGAETGLVIEYRKGAAPPSKIQPNQIPTGLDRVSMKSLGILKEISGVNDSLRGLDASEVSGVAIQAKQSRGLVQMQVPLQNLARTRYYLAQKFLELVQRFYTEERVYQVQSDSDESGGLETLVVNRRQDDGSVLNDLTLGEYAVAISTMPARDTYHDSQFAEALALRQAGVALPDHKVIEYSNLSQKHEISKLVKKMSGLGEPSPEEMQALQAQNELVMRKQALELGIAEAELKKTLAEAELKAAQAASLAGADGDGEKTGVEYEVRLEEIEKEYKANAERVAADLQIAREKLQAMLETARLDRESKERQVESNLEAQKIIASMRRPAAGSTSKGSSQS